MDSGENNSFNLVAFTPGLWSVFILGLVSPRGHSILLLTGIIILNHNSGRGNESPVRSSQSFSSLCNRSRLAR